MPLKVEKSWTKGGQRLEKGWRNDGKKVKSSYFYWPGTKRNQAMSQIINNPLLKSITGLLGKTMVFRQWRGKLVLANRPARRKSDSEKQKVYIEKFREATQYAKRQMADSASKAEYQEGINNRKHNAYTVALTDYLNAPKVHYIKATDYQGAVGDTITIKATDDFKVVRVTVVIADRNGVMLEQGDASVQVGRPFIWKYQASAVNPDVKGTVIRVAAFDKPGNKSSAEINP
jgi:hypothetical protein